MSRFKLSLRDLFTAITALCAQFGLVAVYFGVTDAGRRWLLTLVCTASIFLVPVALGVVISDTRRHKPLLSGILAFMIATLLFKLTYRDYDPVFSLLTLFYDEPTTALYVLVVLCCAVTTGLVCAWITRSLSSADDSSSTASGS